MIPHGNRRRLARFAVLGLALLGAPALSAQDRNRPNIVLVYSDDHATAAVGAYGSRLLRTPHIDSLAAEGAIFANAFCTNGICAPARAVVLTGQHSHVNGVRDNGAVFDGSRFTFPQALQAAGYSTALFGKWHLKSDPTGFDRWEVLPGQGDYYNPDLIGPGGQRRAEGYVTDVVTDLAIDWLREGREVDAPFLLMLQHKAPHRTWMPGPDHLDDFDGQDLPEPPTLFSDLSGRGTAAHEQEMTIARHMFRAYDLKLPLLDGEQPEGPDRWADGLLERMTPEQRRDWDAAFGPRNATFLADPPTGDDLVRWKYQRYIKDYARCIASIDDNLGRLLSTLDELGLRDDTLVVYSSDQGFFLGENGFYDKRFMDEPALRLPLLARWPGVIAPRTRIDALVQNLDLAPTFLRAAGLPVPADVQGVDLAPLLSGDDIGWRDAVYYEYFERGIHNVSPHFGVRTDRFKLIRWPDHGEWELFDLATDPHEQRSRHDDPVLAGVRARLEVELRRLRARFDVPEPDAGLPVRDGLDALEWLAGRWFADEGGVSNEETWMAPRGGVMIGVNRMAQDGAGYFFELLRIEASDAGPVLLASPRGAPPTPFTLESLGVGEVAFVNAQNDYPQRIVYRLEGHDRLSARIEAMDGSRAQVFAWSLWE